MSRRSEVHVTWDGLCEAKKHGLDFEGQPCDLCHSPPMTDERMRVMGRQLMRGGISHLDQLLMFAALSDARELIRKLSPGSSRGGTWRGR